MVKTNCKKKKITESFCVPSLAPLIILPVAIVKCQNQEIHSGTMLFVQIQILFGFHQSFFITLFSRVKFEILSHVWIPITITTSRIQNGSITISSERNFFCYTLIITLFLALTLASIDLFSITTILSLQECSVVCNLYNSFALFFSFMMFQESFHCHFLSNWIGFF